MTRLLASMMLTGCAAFAQTRTQTIQPGEPVTNRPGGNPGRTTCRTGTNSPFAPSTPCTSGTRPAASAPARPAPGASGYGCTGSISRVCDAQVLAQVLFERYNTGYPIRVVRLANSDMPNTWLVLLAGTEFNILNQSNTPLTWGEAFRLSTRFRDEVAGVVRNWAPPGSNIILVGHSLGGMVAQNLAADPGFRSTYNVESVITYGSPKTTGQAPGTDYVWFAAANDIVPTINPLNLFSQPPYIWVTVSGFSPWSPKGFFLPGVNAHLSYPIDTDLANYDGLGHRFVSRVLALVRTGSWPGKCLFLDQRMSWCSAAPN